MVTDDNKLIELKKVGNPFHNGRIVRTEYYIRITFKIDGEEVSITPKIDTGSPYTVIGLGNKVLYEYRDRILKNKTSISLYDATETCLDVESYDVTEFCLADDICYKKMRLLFSESLGEKAVIGMDLLSLYELLYLFDGKCKNYLQGTFNLRRVYQTNKILDERIKRTGLFFPATLLSIYDKAEYNVLRYELVSKQHNNLYILRNLRDNQLKKCQIDKVITDMLQGKIVIKDYHLVNRNGKYFLRKNPHN